ncbi:TIGR02677 family protein [Streptantibioticus ferralitis]|uniref:TIGR02677 family protein n=1 Tax=Streptantibioticus ferralitis TaxID=236510 RepID=A0ABT5ZA54_9ACTN|nr:TIGR02677 family protein [Streptantibioticus ferralitis]MDF2260507.1 TIGR02677 family protein [Streptantibioticus ferralitis]
MSDAPPPQPFAYLQAPNAPLYGQVLAVFAQARERFIVHLRPEDVAAELRRGAGGMAAASIEAVGGALEKLVEWGNLRADADTGRVTSVEDFHRARYLYQLTRHGQAALRAVGVYEQALGRRGQLQSVALADIAEQLGSLLVLARAADPDPAKTHLLLLQIAERFGSLADNAQAFMASLRRTIDFQDGDEEAFIAYKDRLVEYIERFIADLAGRGAQIADLLTRLNAAGVERLLLTAGQREAGDAVPDSDEPEAEQARAQATRAALIVWENRWRGLADWFLSRSTRQPSQAKLLRGAAVSAITSLVNTVAALNERHGGRSDRSADFRALARFFAQAPDDAAAHRLWRAAFALTPARHLTVDAATEAAWQDADPAATTPWAEAPPLEISPRLRETGSYERRGMPTRVADRTAARQVLAEQVELEAAQTAAARARLATDGPMLLSELAGPDGLDPHAFRLFLAVLGDALSTRMPGESESSALTGDGTMEVRLKLVDPDTAVEIPTADGVLRGPEHIIEIIDLAPTGTAA